MICTEDKKDYLLGIVKEDTIPAIGCTEPIAVAYAVAWGKKYIDKIDKLTILVSKNIFKNGKSVIIPNTNRWGLDMAAALGITGANIEKGLMLLQDIKDVHVREAERLINEGRITVGYLEESPDVYVEVNFISNDKKVQVILKDSHNNIDMVRINGDIVYNNSLEKKKNKEIDILKDMEFKEIIEIIEGLNIDDIKFIKEGIEMNKNAALIGLEKDGGLNIGSTLKKILDKKNLSIDSSTKARIFTAAAADMRMGGIGCPIATSGGSGNQGLGVILPILIVAEDNDVDEERLLKAVLLGHITNKYVKMYTGKLSSMCGCAIAAGVGASLGITWMLGGNYDQIIGSGQNMLSNLTGMICDGAKETCSFKLATSGGEAVLSAYLALEDIIVKPDIGIIGKDLEKTIEKVGILCNEGLSKTDDVIIKLI